VPDHHLTPPAPAPDAPGPLLPVPSRWRYQPVAAALWQCLGMDGPALKKALHDASGRRLNVLAAQAVTLASGNLKAIGLIADRIEGRVGIRSGEADPASDVAREGVQQAIEDIVRGFTEAKLAQAEQANGTPSDAALDITALDSPNAVPPGRPTHDSIDAVVEHPR
jgi:hypothetical protein